MIYAANCEAIEGLIDYLGISAHLVALHKKGNLRQNSGPVLRIIVFERVALAGQHARNQQFVGRASVSFRVVWRAALALNRRVN